MNKIITILLLILFSPYSYSQINTGVIVLNAKEQLRFQNLIKNNPESAKIYDSLVVSANNHLRSKPKPIKIIHYEGLLDNNPKRIESIESLLDANKVVDLIYAAYGKRSKKYGEKIKEMVMAWSETYIATGNPINENKLIPFFWGYYIHQDLFNKQEQQKVESWMLSIALKEYNRETTPNNNWQAKRLKIIGLIGGITDTEKLIQFTIDGIKAYISTAYYPDGTSNDLKTRDALHYHVSGIKPLLDIFINYQIFDERFDLYTYTDRFGTSINKSIEYIIPYLSGEKTHKEWVNSQVKLDKERADAGIDKYQPGKLFEPKDAVSMLNWAVYYNSDLFVYICGCKTCYTCNIEALLNSPLIRN